MGTHSSSANIDSELGGNCLFVSDLHGNTGRYEKLFKHMSGLRPPSAVFIGGDVLPNAIESDFYRDYFVPQFSALKERMGSSYPSVFIILGNDDPRYYEPMFVAEERNELWSYIHGQKRIFQNTAVFGYSCVPPTPFRLKDWERYDVSRYCDPGCVSPDEGVRTVAVPQREITWGTIKDDLEKITGTEPLDTSVLLFHSPPYDTPLDRAALDGKQVEHAPLDVHVGSIAIRRFIEARQPRLTLHGHVHESARITGQWMTNIGKTVCLSAAHDGPELAIVRFELAAPQDASRELV